VKITHSINRHRLEPDSKAVHRAYAKRALIKIPSPEQSEQQAARQMDAQK
jgi:hypothetical protein